MKADRATHGRWPLNTGNAHMTLSLINTVLTFIGHTVGTLGAKW